MTKVEQRLPRHIPVVKPITLSDFLRISVFGVPFENNSFVVQRREDFWLLPTQLPDAAPPPTALLTLRASASHTLNALEDESRVPRIRRRREHRPRRRRSDEG